MSFESTKDEIARDAANDMADVDNVLKLRAALEGNTPAAPESIST
jgi:hypothetical protein